MEFGLRQKASLKKKPQKPPKRMGADKHAQSSTICRSIARMRGYQKKKGGENGKLEKLLHEWIAI